MAIHRRRGLWVNPPNSSPHVIKRDSCKRGRMLTFLVNPSKLRHQHPVIMRILCGINPADDICITIDPLGSSLDIIHRASTGWSRDEQFAILFATEGDLTIDGHNGNFGTFPAKFDAILLARLFGS